MTYTPMRLIRVCFSLHIVILTQCDLFSRKYDAFTSPMKYILLKYSTWIALSHRWLETRMHYILTQVCTFPSLFHVRKNPKASALKKQFDSKTNGSCKTEIKQKHKHCSGSAEIELHLKHVCYQFTTYFNRPWCICNCNIYSTL